MKKISVFTSTRAEYGLLRNLMFEIDRDESLTLQLLVSGTHLAPGYGNSFQEISADGFQVTESVEMLLNSDTDVGKVKSAGLAVIGYSDALRRMEPDALVVLGDRFELMAVVYAAFLMQIPIVHLHGGEVTEGAQDDSIRHAITKLSSLHFVATERYRQRVIQLGESPTSVFNVGALGVDAIVQTTTLSAAEFRHKMKMKVDENFFLVTYHPVTAADEDPEVTISTLLRVTDEFPEYRVLVTYPNADRGGIAISNVLDKLVASHPDRYIASKSLGSLLYFSALKYAAVVIGNSSSGLLEAPVFNTPTLNVGVRQLGRLSSGSVHHCGVDFESMVVGLRYVLSDSFKKIASEAIHPFGAGNSSSKIVEIIKPYQFEKTKKFFDLELPCP